jgi:putative endonuclease
MYYYVYILLSSKDNQLCTGYTHDLKNRVEEHNKGMAESTKKRRPLQLVYFEGCISQKDDLRREKYLKSGSGEIYIRNRIKYFLSRNENPTG